MTKYEDLPRDEQGNIEPLKVEFPIEFRLSTPIEPAGRKLDSLTAREPTVRDVEIADKEKTGLGRMLRLISLVAEVSPDDLRGLGTRDYTRLQELLGCFL